MDHNLPVNFSTALWGFHRGEVRQYVEALRGDLTQAREQVAALRFEVETSVARAAMDETPSLADPVVLLWPLDDSTQTPASSGETDGDRIGVLPATVQATPNSASEPAAVTSAPTGGDFTTELGELTAFDPDQISRRAASANGASGGSPRAAFPTAPSAALDDFVPLAGRDHIANASDPDQTHGAENPRRTETDSSEAPSDREAPTSVGSNLGKEVNRDVITESDALTERLTPSVDRVLAECAASARSIEDRAHERTEALIEQARSRAQGVLDDARLEREAILERTHSECAELIDAMHQALAEAEQTRSEAVKASERAAWAATDKLRTERSSLEREIIELTAQRDALNDQLTGVRTSLQRIMDNVPDWAHDDVAESPRDAHPAGPELSVDLRAPVPAELDLRISPETSPPVTTRQH